MDLSPGQLIALMRAKGDDMDWKKSLQNINDSMSNTYESSVNTLLDRLGLEQKRSTMDVLLPSLGIFGAGIAVGAALGVLFAPKRGDEIRDDLRSRVDQLRERGYESYEQLRAQGSEAIGEESAQEKPKATPQAE